MIDPLFQPACYRIQEPAWRDKAMVYHLAGEASLEIENEWNMEPSRQDAANQRTFVQMGMDHIGFVSSRGRKRF